MQDTYNKILDVACDLIIKQGYTATSIRQIAEACGIGKATVYHHFENKESIAFALLTMKTDEMQGLLKSINDVKDPLDRFRKAAAESMRILMFSAEIFQILRREIPECRERLQMNFISFFSAYASLLAESLKEGQAAGLFRSIDPEETAQVFLSILQGSFASAYITGKKPKSPEKSVNSILDIFMNGILEKGTTAFL